MRTKINLSEIKEDVFYNWVYPIYAKEFLFLCATYENFANLVEKDFVLSSVQWEYVLDHWEDKENLLTE